MHCVIRTTAGSKHLMIQHWQYGVSEAAQLVLSQSRGASFGNVSESVEPHLLFDGN